MASGGGGGFGFSWADEVEREEEQQRQIRIQNQNHDHNQEEAHADTDTDIKRKPDPFGAAGPREVILEERGVDWKNLDHDFNFDSSAREYKRKTKTTKKPLELDFQKSRNALPLPQKQAVPCEGLVPPLKYPPKNINLVFEEIHRARNLKPNGCQNKKMNGFDQRDGTRVSVGSNAKRALQNTGKRPAYSRMPHEPPTNGSTLSNLNSVLVKRYNKRKEKTGSNFEANPVKENGRKEEEHAERRRVLAELNDSRCKTVPGRNPYPKPSSNSYFGVLELLELEPTSLEESNSPAKMEARKQNLEKPPATTISKSTGGKRSKR